MTERKHRVPAECVGRPSPQPVTRPVEKIVLELLAITEPAPDIERRSVVTADQAICAKAGVRCGDCAMAPPIAPTPTADKATATATPVINCLTALRMFVSHPS